MGPLLHTVVEANGSVALDNGNVTNGMLLGLYRRLIGGDQYDSSCLHTNQYCVEFGQAMTLWKQWPAGSDRQ